MAKALSVGRQIHPARHLSLFLTKLRNYKTHARRAIISAYTAYITFSRSKLDTSASANLNARACPVSKQPSRNGRWLPFITATVKARPGIRSTRPVRGPNANDGFVGPWGCARWFSTRYPRRACAFARTHALFDEISQRHANHSF